MEIQARLTLQIAVECGLGGFQEEARKGVPGTGRSICKGPEVGETENWA